jgi:hypothetical protein
MSKGAMTSKTPANHRPGVKSGSAPHAVNKKSGFDQAGSYAEFAKTKIGIGKDKAKG